MSMRRMGQQCSIVHVGPCRLDCPDPKAMKLWEFSDSYLKKTGTKWPCGTKPSPQAPLWRHETHRVLNLLRLEAQAGPISNGGKVVCTAWVQ